MKKYYLRLLEKELERLYISLETVLIHDLGKDKFMISDGRRTVYGKGHEIYRITKQLQDRASYGKFWAAMKQLKYTEHNKVTIESE